MYKVLAIKKVGVNIYNVSKKDTNNQRNPLRETRAWIILSIWYHIYKEYVNNSFLEERSD